MPLVVNKKRKSARSRSPGSTPRPIGKLRRVISVFRTNHHTGIAVDGPAEPTPSSTLPPSALPTPPTSPITPASTAPTSSLFTPPLAASASKSSLNLNNNPAPKDNFQETTSVQIAETVTSNQLGGTAPPWFESGLFPSEPIVPSIATLEKVASAKAYFETFYNTILSEEQTPRSLRRHAFERRLAFQAMSNEDRLKRREAWYVAETSHLRHTRSIKAGSRVRRHMKGFPSSKYECVRVLGKGSFGLVRLVREKSVVSENNLSRIDAIDGASSQDVVTLTSAQTNHTILSTQAAFPSTQKKVYAMKVIKKSEMLKNSQEAHLRAERDFLVAAEHSRWVVPLVASFQDGVNLYLVMEYMVGGDFLGLLLREDVLDENITKWYIAQMILCIEETHKMSWIHRDVKPDNFLITGSGHLRISDFGLAFDGHWAHNQTYYNDQRYTLIDQFNIDVRGDDQDMQEELSRACQFAEPHSNGLKPTLGESRRQLPPRLDYLNSRHMRKFARSVVGTSQYMAPEVIKGDVYDGRCDWWSIGIIMYECLYGSTPFFNEDRTLTKERIRFHKHYLQFPNRTRIGRPNSSSGGYILADVSVSAINLIQGLLEDKEWRLSSPLYRNNDQPRVRGAGNSRYPRAGGVLNPRPGFVYPYDAEDIKGHSFFNGINWEIHHLTRPPFVPKVGERDIAKYFDDEKDILSDSDDDSSSHSEPDLTPTSIYPHSAGVLGPQLRKTRSAELQGHIDSQYKRWNAAKQTPQERGCTNDRKRPKKQQKRPRDKLLRDPAFKKVVMDVRKKNAFVGYTWRSARYGFVMVGQGDETLSLEGTAIHNGDRMSLDEVWSGFDIGTFPKRVHY